MNKKILIVGGNGFLGYNLAIKLSKFNYQIFLLCKKKNLKLKRIKNANYIYCNILNKNELIKKLNINFDYVINFSGNINHKNKIETFQLHYEGLKNLVYALKKKKIKLFIQAGTSLEYGNLPSPQKESKKCNPISNYGKAKNLASEYLLGKKCKFNSVILRLYQIYGPYQKKNRLIPLVIKSCLNNEKFKCTEGLQKRDFLYVDDLSLLIKKIINKKKIISGIYNVGYGQQISVREVINTIKKISKGGEPLFGEIKMRKDEIPYLFPNTNKTSKYFKWKPKTKILAGLKKTIKYYEKNKF